MEQIWKIRVNRSDESIDQIHKTQNAPVPYPTIVDIQNRSRHISALNGALWDVEWVHPGICELGQLGTFGIITQKQYECQQSHVSAHVYFTVWYKTKFGSQDLATKFGNHLCMATKIGSQY